MRIKPIFLRYAVSIVQQTNVMRTRDVLQQLASGVGLDLNTGSISGSYDFDDQTKVDFDAPLLQESNNLIHQSLRRQELVDHFNPTLPVDPTPPVEPTPTVEPTPQVD